MLVHLFFTSRRRHTRWPRDWSSDVCSSDLENSQLHALQENYEMELAARVQAATTELQERLDMREVELFYRHQQERNLKDEIARLKDENQSLVNQSGGQLLNKLSEAGITFVTYQPGAEHMTIKI